MANFGGLGVFLDCDWCWYFHCRFHFCLVVSRDLPGGRVGDGRCDWTIACHKVAFTCTERRMSERNGLERHFGVVRLQSRHQASLVTRFVRPPALVSLAHDVGRSFFDAFIKCKFSNAITSSGRKNNLLPNLTNFSLGLAVRRVLLATERLLQCQRAIRFRSTSKSCIIYFTAFLFVLVHTQTRRHTSAPGLNFGVRLIGTVRWGCCVRGG